MSNRKTQYASADSFVRLQPLPTARLTNNSYKLAQKEQPTTIDMTWEETQTLNSGNPEVWGPAFWFTLHNSAAKYPEKASPLCAERAKGFILGIPVMVPCEKCSDHVTAHIEKNWNRLDEVVSGREQLFRFFCDFHNAVNKRYNKPEMSYENAWKLYTGNAKISKLSYSSSA